MSDQRHPSLPPNATKASEALLWLSIAIVAWLAFSYHRQLCFFPYQLGPSEAGMLTSALALQRGWDPWSTALAPQYCNLYGIGLPWLTVQVGRLAPGTDLMLLMRLITAGSLWFVLGLFYLTLRDAKAGALVAAATCLAVYCSLLYFDTQAARPDGLVLALFYLSVIWSRRPGMGNAVFAGALPALAFFVKPTGLIALGLVGALNAAQGRWRDALAAALAGMLSGALLMALILWRYPQYLLGTITHHLHAQTHVWIWMLKQWLDLAQIHAPWILALTLVLALALRGKRALFPAGAWRPWALAAVLVLLILVAGPGGNLGAYLTYYNQILLPFLFLAGALWLLAQGLSVRWLALVLLLDSASALYFDIRSFPPNTAAQTQAWAQADDWVAKHPDSVLPPMFTSIAVKHGAFITDTDHTHGLLVCTWNGQTQLKDAYIEHMGRIDQRLQKGEFQGLVCGGNWPCPNPKDMVRYGYKEVEPFFLRSPLTTGTLRLTVYERDLSKRPAKSPKERS